MPRWFQKELLEQELSLVQRKMWEQGLLDVETIAVGEGQGPLDTSGRRDNVGTLATGLRVILSYGLGYASDRTVS